MVDQRIDICLIAECSEEVYNFPSKRSPFFGGDPVYGDIELQRSCHAEQERWKQGFVKNTNSQHNKLHNKCGETLNPKLLSFWQQQQKRSNTSDNAFVVPNIVHYVSLGHWEFSFLNYLSFKSVHKFIQPEAIYIHGDGLPYGRWFDRMLKEVANVYQVVRPRPVRIQGRQVMGLEHSSDIIRLQTLYGNGFVLYLKKKTTI